MLPGKTNRAKGLIDAIFILAVSIFIMIPLIAQFTSYGTTNDLNENRNLATLPNVSLDNITSIPREFDKYFDDHFPFRSAIIRKSNLIRSLWLKQPSDHVIVGNGNWLFYKGDDIFEDLMGKKLLSEPEIENWLQAYKEKEDWLSKHGIGYFLVSIPNKSTIHKEKLPWWLKANIENSRLTQLTRANDEQRRVNWLDLTQSIQDIKDAGLQTYWHNDTHWSGYSMQAALERIFYKAKEFLPEINPNELNDLSSMTSNKDPGDLSNLIGLNQDWPRDDRYQLRFDAPKDLTQSSTAVTQLERYKSIPPDHHTYPLALEREEGHGTVVVFHDSFLRVAAYSNNFPDNFPAALPFKRTVMIWARPTREEIEDVIAIEHPDLVIEVRVERLLYDGNTK